MTERVSRHVHLLAPSAAEGELLIDEEAFVFKTAPARYRTVRVVCTVSGIAFVSAGGMAALQGFEWLLGAIAGFAIGGGLLYLGLSPPPAKGLRVDSRQLAVIRKHSFGTDRRIYPIDDVQKLLIWSMQFGHRARAHTQWGLGAKLAPDEIVGLFRGDEREIREIAEKVRAILQREKANGLPVEEARSAQGW